MAKCVYCREIVRVDFMYTPVGLFHFNCYKKIIYNVIILKLR